MPKSILTADANFVVNSDTLAIGDPSSINPHILTNVQPGEWSAFIQTTEDNQGVAFIGAACEELGDLEAEDGGSLTVASGLLAICDGRFFKVYEESDEDLLDTADPFGSFYNGRGVVTEAGEGDGTCDIRVWRRDGVVISVAVYFDCDADDDTVTDLPPLEKALNPAAN